jgi:hypothetical protein
MTPYGNSMRESLEKKLNEASGKDGEKWNVKVETDGVSGALVTKTFLRRMEEQCKHLFVLIPRSLNFCVTCSMYNLFIFY